MRDEPAVGIDIQHAVQAAIEIVAVAELLVGDLAHARHDAHAQHDVDGIGQFDADLGERRTGRPHEIRNDIHRAAAASRRRTARRSLAYIAFGAIQLLVGPASSCIGVQMKVHCSTRATSLGLER